MLTIREQKKRNIFINGRIEKQRPLLLKIKVWKEVYQPQLRQGGSFKTGRMAVNLS